MAGGRTWRQSLTGNARNLPNIAIRRLLERGKSPNCAMWCPFSNIFALAAVLPGWGQAPGFWIEEPGEAIGGQAVPDVASKLPGDGKLSGVAEITSLLQESDPLGDQWIFYRRNGEPAC